MSKNTMRCCFSLSSDLCASRNSSSASGLPASRKLVVLLAQNTHGLAAVRRRALGRGGRAVVKEQAHGMAVGRELGLQSHQGLDRFIESHDDLLTFSFSVKIS